MKGQAQSMVKKMIAFFATKQAPGKDKPSIPMNQDPQAAWVAMTQKGQTPTTEANSIVPAATKWFHGRKKFPLAMTPNLQAA
jgi:hypothetical protein